jgi:hypothetical protein
MDECSNASRNGSEERIMANLSLARIMYGTSEDLHASTHTTASTLSSRPTHEASDIADKTAPGDETLAELLHRAWTNLSGKH